MARFSVRKEKEEEEEEEEEEKVAFFSEFLVAFLAAFISVTACALS